MVTFTQTDARINISSGDTLSVLFGKIKKWLNDLRSAAFHEVTNSLEITNTGYVLDARAGKTINDKFGGMRFYEDSAGKWVIGADSVPKKLGDIRDEKAGPVSIVLNHPYATVRNCGVIFAKDDATKMNVKYQQYDNQYEAYFVTEGSNDLKKWTVVQEKSFQPVKNNGEVIEDSYDVDLTGYKYFYIRNTAIADAKMTFISMST